MDNVFEVPFKERGLCNCGEDLREASVLVDNGYVQKKRGSRVPTGHMTLWGILWGEDLHVSLRDSKFAKVCQYSVHRSKRSEAKRNEAEGARLLNFGIKGYKKKGGGEGVPLLSTELTTIYTYRSR